MKTTVAAYAHMEYSFPYVYVPNQPFEQKWRPTVKDYKGADSESLIFIREISIDVDVPDDFNPLPIQVAALEAQKLAALEKYQQEVAEINERLSKLQAITYEAGEVVA